MTKYQFRQAPVVAAIGMALVSGGAPAATITVNSTADGPLGSSPSRCTLRSAVASANSATAVDGCSSGSMGGDQIIFARELAHSIITLSEGQLEITGELTITGPVSEDPLGIYIDADWQSRVLHIYGTFGNEFDVQLEGLTLLNGLTSSGGYQGSGGGIYARNANLHLEHVVVADCATYDQDSMGGGVMIGDGDLVMLNSMVLRNQTHGNSANGGGLFVLEGDAQIKHSVISGNATGGEDAHGGGMYFRNLSSHQLDVYNSVISLNSTEGSSAMGGGLFLRGVGGPAALISHSEVTENDVNGDYSYGGGLYANGINLDLLSAELRGNRATGHYGHGGGLFQAGGQLIAGDSVLDGNSAQGEFGGGGGMAVASVNALMMTTKIVNNYTSDDFGAGGGIWQLNSGVGLLHSTLADNQTAGYGAIGGGLAGFFGGHVIASYSTISGNSTTGTLGRGGGLFVGGGDIYLHLFNSTLSGNSTAGQDASGGGINSTVEVTLTHATVAFNSAAHGIDGIDVSGNDGELLIRNSLIVQASPGELACGIPATAFVGSLVSDASCNGTATAFADINIGPLSNQGGVNLTHPLLSGSQAIDLGGDCNADFMVTNDQRQQARPGAGSAACDAGAYEAQTDLMFRDRFQL